LTKYKATPIGGFFFFFSGGFLSPPPPGAPPPTSRFKNSGPLVFFFFFFPSPHANHPRCRQATDQGGQTPVAPSFQWTRNFFPPAPRKPRPRERRPRSAKRTTARLSTSRGMDQQGADKPTFQTEQTPRNHHRQALRRPPTLGSVSAGQASGNWNLFTVRRAPAGLLVASRNRRAPTRFRPPRPDNDQRRRASRPPSAWPFVG